MVRAAYKYRRLTVGLTGASGPRRFRLPLTVRLAGLLVLAMSCAALAGTEVASAAGMSIGRADEAGKRVNTAFIDNASANVPGDVAVAANHIYWTTDDGIGRAKLNGIGIEPDFITGLGSTGGLTANDQYLYWGGTTIGRARVDGSDVQPNFMAPSGGADDVAASEQYLYWTSERGIGRANLDGTGADSTFIDTGVTVVPGSPQGVYPPTQLAVNSTRAFWVYSTYNLGTATSDIGRAKLDGSGVGVVLQGGGEHGSFFGPLAADDENVFYRVNSGLNDHEIRSFDARSLGAPSVCCSPWPTTADPTLNDDVGGVAVADGQVYWAHLAEFGLHCGVDEEQRKQNQHGRKVKFLVWFTPCEQVKVRASGRATIAGTDYKLKRTTTTLAPTESSLALSPVRKEQGPILAALKNGKSARADIKVQVTDTSGQSETFSYNVILARR
jgi:hypothetical protein